MCGRVHDEGCTPGAEYGLAVIERARVLNRLAIAAQFRVAAVIAPAGFGKSIAVRQYVSGVPGALIYSVPADATSLLPFVRGFAAALEPLAPAVAASLASALEGARGSAAPGQELAAWIATHLRGLDALLVVDDLHNGEADAEISRFVAALVEQTRDGPRWLFSSRTPLQLPLASWLAYGDSDLVVDAVDLRFTLDEAKESARAAGVAVREDELEQILGLIDGWPAALTFALRTSTRASDLRAVSAGTREMMYRYLAEQVWRSLDERVRAFLRTAAFLPRLETRFLIAGGFDDAAAMIESLRERVAFIGILEDGVYTLHELFRDFVRHQAALEGDESLRAAQVQAGRLLEQMRMYGDALERFVEAGALLEVERALAKYNFELLERGCFEVVERALRTLPAAAASGNAKVLALRAALEDAHGRVDQAERWYAAVLQRADEIPVGFRVAVVTRYARLLYQRGRFDAIPMLQELRERDDLDAAERASIVGVLAMTYALMGRIEEAQAAMAEALELAELGDDLLRARTFGRAGTVAFYADDDAAVEHFSGEATRLALEVGAFAAAARFYSTLLSVHGFAGRLPQAAFYAAQVALNAEKAGDPQARANGLRALVDIEAQRGNAERILEIEHELSTLPYRGPVGMTAFASGKALQLGWSGRFKEAQLVLAAVAESDGTPYQHRLRYALLACLQAGRASAEEARDALARYDAAVLSDTDPRARFDRMRGMADYFAILANVMLQRNTVAQKALRGARHRTPDLEPFGAVLSALLNRDPEQVQAGLRALRQGGLAGIALFVERLAEALYSSEGAAADDEALTPTEAQVLSAMARGLTNQAIADDHGRTINTVRTHVASVLRKLRATSRGEAVAEARRRRLV